jgi:enterobactin synthetase component D / holo-[acyl-carrier protein] synthase
VIEKILPSSVVAVDTREDMLDIELFPQELVALGQAVDKRRREFITARACAREALARLGLPPSSIATGERGQPLWPAGVLGSITHCTGYRACALARAGGDVAGVGIDAEPNEPLPDGLLGEIARNEERAPLAELARVEPGIHWDRLLFSAKEAVYKVWFPIAQQWLGFEDATLVFDMSAQTFQVRLLKPWPGSGGGLPLLLQGRWLALEGLVLTAIALRSPQRA